ncbi:MAG: LPS export ABC transporter periplasmic protein LptC [Lentisphaeraceae bacterium]|nr:LPS export ABC transporter periplasmic protein LptC [Lentisphaeraceae bacterium]
MKLSILILIISLFSVLNAQEKDTIKAKQFSVPEYDKNGKLSCVIHGDKGQIFGKEALISGVLVEIHHKDSPLMLTTPKCKYNLEKKRCSSNEDVDIKGDGVKITGTGFDIDNNDKKIFIRSNVKVVWKKAKINLNKNKQTDKPEDKK